MCRARNNYVFPNPARCGSHCSVRFASSRHTSLMHDFLSYQLSVHWILVTAGRCHFTEESAVICTTLCIETIYINHFAILGTTLWGECARRLKCNITRAANNTTIDKLEHSPASVSRLVLTLQTYSDPEESSLRPGYEAQRGPASHPGSSRGVCWLWTAAGRTSVSSSCH